MTYVQKLHDADDGMQSAHLIDCPLNVDNVDSEVDKVDPQWESFKHMQKHELSRLRIADWEME